MADAMSVSCHNRSHAARQFALLFNHLVGALLYERWHFKPQRLGGLEVDYQFKLSGLLDGQIAWLRAFEDFIDQGSRSIVQIGIANPIAY
jgi:hypothetical protein